MTPEIYLVAFFQGREISFSPPKIGAKPDKSKVPPQNGKKDNGESEHAYSIPDKNVLKLFIPKKGFVAFLMMKIQHLQLLRKL